MSVFLSTFSRILGFLSAVLVFLIILIFSIIFINKSNINSFFNYYEGDKESLNKIAILNLSGPIISESNNLNFFGFEEVIFPSLIKNYLEDIKLNNIKGLIVSINSPGGSVSASKEIFEIFKEYKNTNKIPLYFHSTNMLASGAYWVALSGDKIYANYGALIGSIGVKGPDWIYYNSPTSISSGLLGNSIESPNGIKLFSNIAGASKDILNPFRYPTLKETKKLQQMVDDIYEDFIKVVSANRKIEKLTIINNIGAMIYNTKQAKKNYLINGEKNINEVIQKITKDLKLNDMQIIINNKKKKFNFNNFNILLKAFNNNYQNNIRELINNKFCNNIINEFSVAATNGYLVSC